jgi:tetratricopeptide (TPR) repeat protein
MPTTVGRSLVAVRIRSDSTQSPKVRIPGAPVQLWLAVAAMLGGCLVVLAALVGTRPSAGHPVDVIPAVGAGIEETLRRPVVAAFIAVLFVVFFVGAIRGARLRWLASSPGPVDVADLKVAGALAEGVAERLTLRFRRRLADLHLATPGPQPGIAPGADFVELVGSATRDSKNLFATVAGLLRVAWPSQAYQVQATLVQHPDHGCGVIVQVVMLPTTTTPPTTCWAHSWETAIDRAANHATAFILPRTRVGRRPPWTAWHGYVLPPELLDAYERAALYTHDRRYDEALREYYASLELDPKNLDVRLRIGFIQEKLGLALDALTTYQAICDMTCACRMPGARGSTRRILRKARRRSQAIAGYRRAVLLGSAEGLSKQWCAPPERSEGGRRDEQRRACRDRLRPTLMDLCKREYAATVAHTRGCTLEQLLAEGAAITRRWELLSEVFQVTARVALGELKLPRDLSAGDQSSLTPAAVALSERCVDLRLWCTRRALGETDYGEPPTVETLRAWRGEAGAARRAPWSELYSAASLYALGIGARADIDADANADLDADALAKEAVAELRLAIESADSSYVASRRAWLVSEDPDLEALRGHRRFQRFEATYFPSPNPTVLRPPGAHRWEVVEYVHRLVDTCAACHEEVWRGRLLAAVTDSEAGDVTSWLRDEATAWTVLSEVASNCEHWQTRLKLVERLETWMPQMGFDVALGYPDFASVAPQDKPLDQAIHDARRRLGFIRELAEHQQDVIHATAGNSAGLGVVSVGSSDMRAARRRAVRCARERIAAWHAVRAGLAEAYPRALPAARGEHGALAVNGEARVRTGGRRATG